MPPQLSIVPSKSSIGAPDRCRNGSDSRRSKTNRATLAEQRLLKHSRLHSHANVRPGEPGGTASANHRAPEAGNGFSSAEQLFASSSADIAQLVRLLADMRYSALIRCADGTALPLMSPASGAENELPRSTVIRRDTPPMPAALPRANILSAPIYGAQGNLHGSLEVMPERSAPPHSGELLLSAVLNSVARAISERCFRVFYHRQWIIAAVRRSAPRTCVLLAVDTDKRLMGADHQARRLLEERGGHVEYDLTLHAFFRVNIPPLRGTHSCDMAVSLAGSGEGEPWSGLITPPDFSVTGSLFSERTLLHARPRLETLWALRHELVAEPTKPGLPRLM